MHINFQKVTSTPIDFDIVDNGIVFKGSLKYYKKNLLLLQATLSGYIDLDCYLCSESFSLPLDEDVEFLISDGVYEGFVEEYDVVEAINGKIDIEELLNSEIELIKSGYYSCKNCNKE